MSYIAWFFYPGDERYRQFWLQWPPHPPDGGRQAQGWGAPSLPLPHWVLVEKFWLILLLLFLNIFHTFDLFFCNLVFFFYFSFVTIVLDSITK